MLTAILIALIIYLVVVTRSNIRLPHPGLQATVDIFKMATLKEEHVISMAREFINYSDRNNQIASSSDYHAMRLFALTDKYVSINGVNLNFKVYMGSTINAFAAADGSIRVYSGLMDVMTDDELMAIIGHELGHISNNDTIGFMRKAYMTSAAKNMLSAAGGIVGELTNSQLGSIAEQLAGAKFSQGQEYGADDFSLGFLIRNGYDPYGMANALDKISKIAEAGGAKGHDVAQMFSTHPDTLQRAKRMRIKASALIGK